MAQGNLGWVLSPSYTDPVPLQVLANAISFQRTYVSIAQRELCPDLRLFCSLEYIMYITYVINTYLIATYNWDKNSIVYVYISTLLSLFPNYVVIICTRCD